MYSFEFVPEDNESEYDNNVIVGRDTEGKDIHTLVTMFEQFCLGMTFSQETIAEGFVEWLETNGYLEEDAE